MTDIEIARSTKIKPIIEIAKKINLEEEEIELYGKEKAKICLEAYEKRKNKTDGKLILVTAINPTPLGEGKTTVSIGIADGLNRIGKKAIIALREPSLGPVFGIKGGATGGGKSQIVPMEDINLHFTGDIHAITSANNLLSAMIDNHIYQGNELKIKKVTWKRCVDLNDRQLRKVETGKSEEKNIIPRIDGFDISVASEIMAILCLVENIEELVEKLGKIIIGYNEEEKPVTAKDLKAEQAMAILLKDAIKPNLVQTLEGTPAIIHGGPFANIAHGCNSIIATKNALKYADYCVTEAGFGADLGAEKFLNIKTRKLGKIPDVVVIVVTLKALKYHGGAKIEQIKEENKEALKQGIPNLLKHIQNITKEFKLKAIVAINKFNTDSKEELQELEKILEQKNIIYSYVENYEKGSEGATKIAQKIIETVEKEQNTFEYTYNQEDEIKEKIEKIAKKIYGAEGVEYTEKAEEQIKKIEEMGYKELPICMAKTQYSFTDDAKNLQCKESFKIHVKEIQIKAGAEFIVVITGKIMTMPGLPKKPSAENMKITKDGKISGIF